MLPVIARAGHGSCWVMCLFVAQWKLWPSSQKVNLHTHIVFFPCDLKKLRNLWKTIRGSSNFFSLRRSCFRWRDKTRKFSGLCRSSSVVTRHSSVKALLKCGFSECSVSQSSLWLHGDHSKSYLCDFVVYRALFNIPFSSHHNSAKNVDIAFPITNVPYH